MNRHAQVVPTARSHLQRWAEVVNHSNRSVTLIDLCGHEKYLKTTVFGLTGGSARPVFVYSLGGGQKSHGINGK